MARPSALAADGSLTNAAEVLFCPSVDVQLKMGVFKTHMRTEALDLRQEPGTVFSLVDQAEYYIANNLRRKAVVTGRRTRNEVPKIPFVAIREALMNAVAHRLSAYADKRCYRKPRVMRSRQASPQVAGFFDARRLRIT